MLFVCFVSLEYDYEFESTSPITSLSLNVLRPGGKMLARVSAVRCLIISFLLIDAEIFWLFTERMHHTEYYLCK